MSPARKCQACMYNALNFIVFLFLDFLDAILCVVYKCLDKLLEGKISQCYCCGKKRKSSSKVTGEDVGDCGLSGSLFGRSDVFSKMGVLSFRKQKNDNVKPVFDNSPKWSDCNCKSCLSWTKVGSEKLHVVVEEPEGAIGDKTGVDNVIFIHGFLCSSSFWTESVFKNLPESAKQNYRLFAFDLLGLGKSPKPMDCYYTLKDHLEMIENSVINPYELGSFHLVAHSMGCVVALALAAKYYKSIKSVTLVAPACFACGEDEDGVDVLKKLAKKELFPLLAFHTSIMAWYEHLGRSICFLVCRHHIMWERLIKLFTKRRELSFAIKDLTKHTHHSAWHNVHNVICGGAKYMDGYLEILKRSEVKISIIHGDRDTSIPMECSYDIKRKVPSAELSIIPRADHSSVILRRKKEFTQKLEHFWASTR